MKKMLCYYMLFLGIIGASVTPTAAAQSGVQNKEVDECVANLDMKRVDFRKPPYNLNSYMLQDYFACRGAANNDKGECNNLLSPEQCTNLFKNWWLFSGRLILGGRITPDIKAECMASIKSDNSEKICMAVMKGLLNDNVSACNELGDNKIVNYCIAMVKQDVGLLPDEKNLLIFISALKTMDIKKCDDLKTSNLKWFCKGAVSQNTNICETNAAVREYKRKTCIDEIRLKKSFGLGGKK